MSEKSEENELTEEVIHANENDENLLNSTEATNGESEQNICFDVREMETMMESLEEKNRLLQESDERLKRLQADFENFRRRTRQEKEELSQIVTQNVILDIVPVLDNFERALSSAATQDAASVMAGVEMIYRQFSALLEKVGLEPIEAVGQQFDPQKHEAVMRVQDAEQPDGLIVEELQKGYVVCGKVIRPSMVKVVNND